MKKECTFFVSEHKTTNNHVDAFNNETYTQYVTDVDKIDVFITYNT